MIKNTLISIVLLKLGRILFASQMIVLDVKQCLIDWWFLSTLNAKCIKKQNVQLMVKENQRKKYIVYNFLWLPLSHELSITSGSVPSCWKQIQNCHKFISMSQVKLFRQAYYPGIVIVQRALIKSLIILWLFLQINITVLSADLRSGSCLTARQHFFPKKNKIIHFM